MVRLNRQLDPNRVTGPDFAARIDNAQDTGFANEVSMFVSVKNCSL
jgi:hypothetical protein